MNKDSYRWGKGNVNGAVSRQEAQNAVLVVLEPTQVLTEQQPFTRTAVRPSRPSVQEENVQAIECENGSKKIFSCLICGCPSLWSDRYTGNLHCDECEPPPGQSLIARRYFVLITCSGKQALLELDRETLTIDQADYDRVFNELQSCQVATPDDTGQWSTWTEPDGTVVTVATEQVEAHRLGRWGAKPGMDFEKWWSAGSDGKFLDGAIKSIQNAATRGRAPA